MGLDPSTEIPSQKSLIFNGVDRFITFTQDRNTLLARDA